MRVYVCVCVCVCVYIFIYKYADSYKFIQDPDPDPGSDPELSEKSDPDPGSDPKQIIPDPQHWFRIRFWIRFWIRIRIRIQNVYFGSGSGQKFRILTDPVPDPDPQHCLYILSLPRF
jgi:hypothetical protein